MSYTALTHDSQIFSFSNLLTLNRLYEIVKSIISNATDVLTTILAKFCAEPTFFLFDNI